MASTGGSGTAASTGGAQSNSAPASRSRGDGNRNRGRGRGGGGGGGEAGGAGAGGPEGTSRGPRGRGRGDGARGGSARGKGRGGNANASSTPVAAEATDESNKPTQLGKVPAFKNRPEPEGDGDDDDVCFICASPFLHRSIAPCNHSTCYICALRLRALYKNKDCPHCRTSAPFVIFTDDATRRYEDYTDNEITSTDDNVGIRYTSEDIVGDTILLLRYNCPDADCDFAGLSWPNLHHHVRSVHHKKMCDLCTRSKKVFTHEHDVFNDKELGEHMRHGDDRPGAIDQTGFKGHPLCGFCGERFYDDDKLYEHCRNKHERCFLCDRRDSRKPHYYQDYSALEAHFKNDHYICLDRECLEKKFVVFESEIDLKGHQLSEHAGSLSKDVRRDARLVDMASFDFRQPYQQERRGGGGSGGGSSSRENRGRGRDPNAEAVPYSSAQPLRRDELAFQRQMAISSAPQPGPSRAAPAAPYRPNNTTNSAPQSQPPSRPQSTRPIIDNMENVTIADLSSLTPEQRAGLTRHGAVIERASNLLGNNPDKITSFRTYISNYNKGSMTSAQIIDAFFALFTEASSNALGTLIREVADLFDDKKKGEALLKAWQNSRATTEDYPSLPSLQGMHGATTSSSGWAAAAAASPVNQGAQGAATAAAQLRNSTRVLKLKNSTRRASGTGLEQGVMSVNRSGGESSSSSEFRTVGRSNQMSSSAAFPSLPSTTAGSKTPSQPSWIGSSGAAPSSSSSSYRTTTSAPSRGPGTPTANPGGVRRPGATEDSFPALPAAAKPLTTIFGYGRGAVRRDFGSTRSTGFSWGSGPEPSASGAGVNAGRGGGGGNANANPEVEGEDGAGAGRGKKKGKKQVLVQWG
ncbi:hypothetical protein B0T19DRAFT_389001 [Cercophora scortea]|uniref:RING-type E3 ubiquitin transferase n=1 Tax=Cercophora scortea TaxID=314031 RepID=A0AAE0I891_9PEZI|nr:hypothetical protein B0T19DRAFT_389001 [Cercophora scortea]